MIRSAIFGSIMTWVLVPMAAADDAPAASQNHMSALAKFDGEWHVNGKWSNGETLEARTVYHWGLGKKIVMAETYAKYRGKEYQRYENVMTWHPKKKCLYEISFTYDGEISEHVIDAVEPDTLHVDFRPLPDDVAGAAAKTIAPELRQVLKFTDDDHMVWTVTMKQGGEWQQLIEATWVRQRHASNQTVGSSKTP